MEEIYIKPTEVSPEIVLSPSKKIYSIRGMSRPESPYQFYSSLLKWLDEYGAKYLNGMSIVFDLEYFNTPSARTIRTIFAKLESLYVSGIKVNLVWVLNDEASKDEFEYEFAHDLTIPIHFKKPTH